MNHKITSTEKNHKTATLLLAVAALAAVLVASAAAVGNVHMALAGKGNDGIKISADTEQKQECQTAGGTSLITGSCTALSTNNLTNSGGTIGEVTR
jgi:catabolite regulation protein CreA